MGEYVIQPGDTLSKIAKMTGTTVEQLQKLNGIKNANLIFAGKTLQIPDIESDQAFNVQGLSVEREIPKGEIRTVYAYIPPEGDAENADAPKYGDKIPGELLDSGSGNIRLLYGYICPGDNKDGGNKFKLPWFPEDGGIRYEPVYAYKPPKGEKGEDDGVPPLLRRPPENDDDTPKWRLVYAYIPPTDREDDDGEKFDIPPYLKRPEDLEDPEIRTVYAYIPPEDDAKDPKITATAKDIELLESRGASKTANDPNGRAQFVVGDETGEVSVTGQKERPDSITIKDDTNGGHNTYTYRLITDKEIADGQTYDGIPLSKGQFEGANGPFYVLIKAVDENGANLKGSHTEVYRLEYTERDDGSRSYDLVQDEGMDGSGRSSMDYRRR